jgi:hypothetical protein
MCAGSRPRPPVEPVLAIIMMLALPGQLAAAIMVCLMVA